MKIIVRISGSGCTKCKNLEQTTREVVRENYIDAEVLKVEDIVQIMNYGVMTTPDLVVNEKVVVTGRIPSKLEFKSLLEKELSGI